MSEKGSPGGGRLAQLTDEDDSDAPDGEDAGEVLDEEEGGEEAGGEKAEGHQPRKQLLPHLDRLQI